MSSFSSDVTDHNFEVKISEYFGRGWTLFKANAVQFILYTLLLAVILGVLAQLPSPLGGRTGGDNPVGGANIIGNILMPILFAGYYFVAFQIARNRPQTFGDFFQGFQKFLPIFLVSLVSSILTMVGFVIFVIPGIYLAVAYLFAQPFVIDKNLEFWSAMETSRKLITKKWFAFFGLALALFALNFVGALVVGIGLLVTLPLTFCIITAAFEDIVGLNSVTDAGEVI
jgi:hypothetical protein